MLLTYNVKHNRDLKELLETAKAIAKYGVANHCKSSKAVKSFGIKSALSNQILRKYVNCKTLKEVNNVVIPVTNQSIKWNGKVIVIPCLKQGSKNFVIPFDESHYPKVVRIKHIELDDTYAHVICEVKFDEDCVTLDNVGNINVLGVDRNTTQHVVVCANLNTGKILKLGKQCQHIHKKYNSLRRKVQLDAKNKKHHKFRKIKKLKHRESNIIRNINHQISRKIVDTAAHDRCIISLENLKRMRYSKKKKQAKLQPQTRLFDPNEFLHPDDMANLKEHKEKFVAKSFRYSLNSWSYYQLQTFIEYKSNMKGIPVVYVPPQYTSQCCSHCGRLGNRNGKKFKCPSCGHADHADVNAAFNIAKRGRDVYGRLLLERDNNKGSADAPKGAMILDSVLNEV